jgi:hypothetical protein
VSNVDGVDETARRAQIGIVQAAAASARAMKKHNVLARRILGRQDDYFHSPPTGEYPRTTPGPNATSA